MTQTASGWYTDPTGSYSYRYWDGTSWTSQVGSGGPSGTDPNPLDPAVAAAPPAPGTAAPEPSTQGPPQAVQVTQKSGGSTFGIIIGVIVAIVAVVILIAVLASGDDESSTSTDAPVTTEAPATTAP